MKKMSDLEQIRRQAKKDFLTVRPDWIDVGSWFLPHRITFMDGQTQGKRNNRHIIDTTHLTAHRSFVAGFSEGNTSATRQWFRHVHPDRDKDKFTQNRQWLDLLTHRVHSLLSSSNFYNATGVAYGDYGVFNTASHWFEEIEPYGIHAHPLEPGSYYVINDKFGIADIMVREFTITVKAMVDRYGRKDPKTGKALWDNFSDRVKDMYERGQLSERVGMVHIAMPNKEFNPNLPVAGENRQYVSYHYESNVNSADTYVEGMIYTPISTGKEKFLKVDYSTRKPFVVGRSDSAGFPYGLKGPGTDGVGIVKSLNKKAISKDVALEKAIDPTLQGPMGLNKTYVTNQARRYIPLDATAMAQGGLRSVYDMRPAVEMLQMDVNDLRTEINKLFFVDYLLYLTANPKTRTAEETRAIIQEQQMVIGPSLQSLNWTYNVPIIEYATSYVIENDPYLPPPPEDLQGEFVRTEMISVFAQAQRSADLPNIDSYIQRVMGIAQVDPSVLQKLNADKYMDILEDRLYLPAGLNRQQDEVDAMREAAQAQAQRQQMMTEMLPALAGAQSDAANAQATMASQQG